MCLTRSACAALGQEKNTSKQHTSAPNSLVALWFRMPSPPPDDLLATAGAALTAARAKKARSSKRTTASARGPLPLAPRTTAPPARPSASLLAVSEAASDADAAASLRSWLASMGGAPKGSRYVRHRIAVVRKALALLEARRSDEQEGELQELLSSLAL